MIIVPSILEKTPAGLLAQIQKLSPYFSYFQIDIADGIFVPNKTVQIEEIPTLPPLSYEFHLMVKDYEKEIVKLEKLSLSVKIKIVLIHLSAMQQYNNTTMKQFNIGIVLNPEDSVASLSKKFNLGDITLIQIMSVNPGFQGQPFLPETLQKVEQLRQINYRNKISLDGGINEQTIPQIISQKYPPDIICPGSFLTKTDDLENHVNYLKMGSVS